VEPFCATKPICAVAAACKNEANRWSALISHRNATKPIPVGTNSFAKTNPIASGGPLGEVENTNPTAGFHA
jgi:hypothetical protein